VVVVALAITILFVAQQRYPRKTTPKARGVALADSAAFAAYAGSAACRDCHPAAYDKWIASNHGLAERPLDDAHDRAAFDPARSFTHGSQATDMTLRDGRYQVIATGLAGRETVTAARVIGNDPLRQFIVPVERGRAQVLEASYDPHRNEWFNVYGWEDRKPGEWGHWTGRGMTWNTMCASCHNTRLRKNYVEATDSFHTAMAEMTVGCEACHGPMKAHAQWRTEHPDEARAGGADGGPPPRAGGEHGGGDRRQDPRVSGCSTLKTNSSAHARDCSPRYPACCSAAPRSPTRTPTTSRPCCSRPTWAWKPPSA